MGTPSVSITKQDFQTGVVAPSPVGVLAIIAPATAGPTNVPSGYTSDRQAWADFGPGLLVEDASYTMAEAGNPVLLCRATAATAAAYGTIDVSKMTGTSVPTAGAAVPADRYDAIITFLTTTTIGGAAGQWTYSLDGGLTVSTVQVLPATVPAVLVIPNFSAGGSPGVSFSMAAGAVNAGDFFRCLTTPAQMTDADLAASLEAMRTTTVPWEALLLEEDSGTGTPGLVDSWLAGLEKVGKFRMAFLNTRFKNQPHVGSGVAETEAAFQTAMATLTGQQTPSIRLSQGTDGGVVTSTLTGLTQPRKAVLVEAARAMGIPIGTEPAYVALGALPDLHIVDSNGGPLFHNEELFPNLDSLQLATLRTVQGQNGVYVTNGRIFSLTNSDYQLVPHVRTMNRACEIAFQILTTQLSRGIGKKPKDPVTGAVYILESDALTIEGLVNEAVAPPLKGQVVAVKFTLSRTDDLSSNQGATLNGAVQLVPLAYIKNFKVTASFAKSISVAA
jgi:hypothetical protein